MKFLFLLVLAVPLLMMQPVLAQQPKPAAKPATAQPVLPGAADDSVQIGYIDGVRVENDTRRAFEISEALRKEFGSREAEVRGMEEKVKSLQQQVQSTTQPRERELREREFQTQVQRLQQMGRALYDDIERRKGEERRKYFVEVTAIVNRIAEAQKLDLVLQEAVYAGKAVDLTELVIKQLGGPAPASLTATGAPAVPAKPQAKPPAK